MPYAEETQDLLPDRLKSDKTQIFERGMAISIVIVTLTTIIFCLVHGFSYHHEHIIMGGLVFLGFVQFALIGRAYGNDVIQDRVLVYYSALAQIALCGVGLLYAVHWGPAAPCYGDCIESSNDILSFYNPYITDESGNKGKCLKFNGINSLPFKTPVVGEGGKPQQTFTGSPCQLISFDQSGLTMTNLTGTTDPHKLTCQTARNLFQRCYSGLDSRSPFLMWQLPYACNKLPPTPPPSPGPHPGPAPNPAPRPTPPQAMPSNPARRSRDVADSTGLPPPPPPVPFALRAD